MSLDPSMRDPDLRAADADRDAVAALLRDAHAEGRLGLDEFHERLDAALTARTYGELVPLTADLPREDRPGDGRRIAAARVVPPAPRPERGHRGSAGLAAAWSVWGFAVSVNVVIWVLVSLSAGRPVHFWPMWVAGPWGAVLVLSTLGMRRAGPGGCSGG